MATATFGIDGKMANQSVSQATFKKSNYNNGAHLNIWPNFRCLIFLH